MKTNMAKLAEVEMKHAEALLDMALAAHETADRAAIRAGSYYGTYEISAARAASVAALTMAEKVYLSARDAARDANAREAK